jgi:hypothetical protein
VEVLTRGYKLLLRIAKSDVYKGWWVPGELDDSFLETKSDEELETIVKSRCTTLCVYIVFTRVGRGLPGIEQVPSDVLRKDCPVGKGRSARFHLQSAWHSKLEGY